MTKKQSIYKPKQISGFPEWLPEERIVEQRWQDHIRKTFESYGFCSIETPSVEEIDVLTAKGEVDKEIYVLERLHKDEDNNKDSRLALHFDQTVPFARYTAQHFNELVFPFKRYQMQRVWRGERPQMGRMREFMQCDIDVISIDNLPLSFDAEIPAVIYEVLDGLDIGRVLLRISNRKIMYGYLEACNIKAPDLITVIVRAFDKAEKIGAELATKEILDYMSDNNIDPSLQNEDVNFSIGTFLMVAGFSYSNSHELINGVADEPAIEGHEKGSISGMKNLINKISSLEHNKLFNEGIEELSFVLDNLAHLPEHAVVADLSIVRGLDYYTGTVYETQLLDVPEFTGSVCSGGRYDDLAGSFINKHLPGVGISIGFSRLFDVIRQSRPDLMKIGAKSPTDILVYTEDKDLAQVTAKTAQTLRKRGFNVEVYHTVKKWEKHFKYADKKVIPYIWYVRGENTHEIKTLETGEQISADPDSWNK